jgi:hypothetical protein
LHDSEPHFTTVGGGLELLIGVGYGGRGVFSTRGSPSTPQPTAEPLEDLVLELTDVKVHEQGVARRASARARLIYEPATPGRRDVASAQAWRFIAPLGPIEAEELRWYLETYAVWPSDYDAAGPAGPPPGADARTWGCGAAAL